MDALPVVAYSLIAADYSQTSAIADSCNRGGKFRENGLLARNLIGACPTSANVTKYFVTYTAAVYGLSETLPERYKHSFLLGVAIAEGLTVLHNRSVGLKFDF